MVEKTSPGAGGAGAKDDGVDVPKQYHPNPIAGGSQAAVESIRPCEIHANIDKVQIWQQQPLSKAEIAKFEQQYRVAIYADNKGYLIVPTLKQCLHGELFFDAIIEGPIKWTVRPVFEVYSDSIINQSQTFSALVGAIWQVRDNLAFDLGLRYAFVTGRPVSEVRAGVTFGFPLNLARPISPEILNAPLIGRH
jgi:hypothetical protein